jgi:DNA-directed RNA polymerase subunit E'/Rpb7
MLRTIDKLLEEKVKTQYEGRCSRNGYVLPGSVKLISRSIGIVEEGRFTGECSDYAEASSKVLQPPDGFILVGEVIRKNKVGMYVNYKDAIRVMIPRDLHIGDEDFESVNVGESVRVEIKRIHDTR